MLHAGWSGNLASFRDALKHGANVGIDLDHQGLQRFLELCVQGGKLELLSLFASTQHVVKQPANVIRVRDDRHIEPKRTGCNGNDMIQKHMCQQSVSQSVSQSSIIHLTLGGSYVHLSLPSANLALKRVLLLDGVYEILSSSMARMSRDDSLSSGRSEKKPYCTISTCLVVNLPAKRSWLLLSIERNQEPARRGLEADEPISRASGDDDASDGTDDDTVDEDVDDEEEEEEEEVVVVEVDVEPALDDIEVEDVVEVEEARGESSLEVRLRTCALMPMKAAAPRLRRRVKVFRFFFGSGASSAAFGVVVGRAVLGCCVCSCWSSSILVSDLTRASFL